jgi:hypothetical protein
MPRHAKRPRVYAVMMLAAALILAVCVAVTWRLSNETTPAPASVATR